MRFAVAVLMTLAVLAVTAGTASAIGSADWTLVVEKTGNGYVSGSGIDCGTTCSTTIPGDCAYDPDIGHVVCDAAPATVTAANANGYAFQSWSGCDTTSGNNCTVTGFDTTTVTANFSDVQAPTVSLTSPTAAQNKTGTFTLSATGTDNSGTLAKVDFFVRGAKVATDATAPYSIVFDSTTIADGSATVSAVAYDASGNASPASQATITIDNTAPYISAITGPGAGPFGPGTTQTMQWTANDPASGLKSVQCKLDSGAFTACTGVGTMSYSNLSEGPHTLTVLATDNVDHTSSRTYAWSIDATAPVAQIDSGPADGSSSTDTSASFSFSANEPSSFGCRVYQAALTPPAFAVCSGAMTHTISDLAPGTYAFEVVATDAVGNASAPVKRTFTITSPPPAQQQTTPPASNGGSGQPATVPDSPQPSSATRQAIAAAIAAKWTVRAGKTTAKTLKLTKVPAGATVLVGCRGKQGCPFKSKSFTVPAAGRLDLHRALKRALAAGTKVTIVIRAAGMTGEQIMFVMQKRKPPKRTSGQLP